MTVHILVHIQNHIVWCKVYFPQVIGPLPFLYIYISTVRIIWLFGLELDWTSVCEILYILYECMKQTNKRVDSREVKSFVSLKLWKLRSQRSELWSYLISSRHVWLHLSHECGRVCVVQVIQRQLEEVGEKQRDLEERGVTVEKIIRGETGTEPQTRRLLMSPLKHLSSNL